MVIRKIKIFLSLIHHKLNLINNSMSIPPPPPPHWSPYGHFVTSDPRGLPVDRRPLQLGLYLQNQTFSPVHSTDGAKLLQKFKYSRGVGWAGSALFGISAICAFAPPLLDLSTRMLEMGVLSGGIVGFSGFGLQFWSKIKIEEISAQMESEFGGLKEKIILHNNNFPAPEKQRPVPYLADPSLSERLANAQINQTNSNTANNLSNVPSNMATAGIMLEALKTFKDLKNKN